MDPAIIQLLAGLAQAVPAVLDALMPDVRASVVEEMRAARARLPAAGSVTSAVDAVVARYVAPSHEED